MADKTRCTWCLSYGDFINYHDEEWGVPLHNDRHLFEMLILEGAQAGLNWLTVLKKRAGYRAAFDNFEAEKIVRYDEQKLASLVQNPNIIRHKLKINSVVKNAKGFLKIQEEFGSFNQFIWQFVDGQPIINNFSDRASVPARTAVSDAMSKALKKRGFSFVGSTICYAYMQGVGMVNDHTVDCYRWQEVQIKSQSPDI
ncbi:MAG: DNA-3-methyladenine glycosylase I [Bacteroidota bacterium]